MVVTRGGNKKNQPVDSVPGKTARAKPAPKKPNKAGRAKPVPRKKTAKKKATPKEGNNSSTAEPTIGHDLEKLTLNDRAVEPKQAAKDSKVSFFLNKEPKQPEEVVESKDSRPTSATASQPPKRAFKIRCYDSPLHKRQIPMASDRSKVTLDGATTDRPAAVRKSLAGWPFDEDEVSGSNKDEVHQEDRNTEGGAGSPAKNSDGEEGTSVAFPDGNDDDSVQSNEEEDWPVAMKVDNDNASGINTTPAAGGLDQPAGKKSSICGRSRNRESRRSRQQSTDSAALSDSTEGSGIGEKLAKIESKTKKPPSPSSSRSSCGSPSRTTRKLSPIIAYTVHSDSSVSSLEQDNAKAPARSSEDGPIKKVTATETGRAPARSREDGPNKKVSTTTEGHEPLLNSKRKGSKAKPQARKTATAKRANKPNPDLKRPASQTNRGIHRYREQEPKDHSDEGLKRPSIHQTASFPETGPHGQRGVGYPLHGQQHWRYHPTPRIAFPPPMVPMVPHYGHPPPPLQYGYTMVPMYQGHGFPGRGFPGHGVLHGAPPHQQHHPCTNVPISDNGAGDPQRLTTKPRAYNGGISATNSYAEDAEATAPRIPYRGRACVGDDESNDQELQRQLRNKRSGQFSTRPSQFKDRLARSKEKVWHQHFFKYAMMQTMESDGWDDLDDTLFDDGVEGQRIVPAQMVYDPFYNHQVVGGAPKAAEPVREKPKPQLLIAVANKTCEEKFKELMKELVENDFRSTEDFELVFSTSFEDCWNKRNDNEDRKRLKVGTAAAAAAAQTPSTRARATTAMTPADANDQMRSQLFGCN